MKRDPRVDPRPGDVVGTFGPHGKKAKCCGLTTTETETTKDVKVSLNIAFTAEDFDGKPHTRSLAEWRKLVATSEVIHAAD